MKKLIVILACVLLSSFSLFADENPSETVEPGYHEHDGFYFRFYLNPFVGYGYVHSVQNINPLVISDSIMTGGLQIGYAIKKNLFLFYGIDILSIPPLMNPLNILPKAINPNVQRGKINNPLAGILGFSGGINYYFMPENVYVIFALNLSAVSITADSFKSASDVGLGFQTAIGKEWWYSRNIGLGLALNIAYDYFSKTYPGDPIVTPLHAFMIGISFSATYN